MPDVGVLQLKIAANVRSATDSLKTLKNRLADITKETEKFNLSNVSTQIGEIVNTVKGSKEVSTAVRNLGLLLNAIAAFSSVTKIGLNKTQINQLKTLQEVVSGFNLGNSGTQLNKMREALGGEWNTEQAEKARQAIETLAQGTKTLTESGTTEKIKELSSSFSAMSGTAGKDVKEAAKGVVDYQKVVDELGSTLKETQVTFKEPLMSLNLQQFGGTPKFENASVQNWRDTMNGIKDVNTALKQTDDTSVNNILALQKALSVLAGAKGADGLQKFADGIRNITRAAESIGNAHLTINRLSTALERIGNIGQSFKLPSFTKLENLARTLQENFSAESGLKRLAEGINAFKKATTGLDLSNAKGISAIIKSMNANISGSGNTAKVVESMGESAKTISESAKAASEVKVSSGFAETAQKISEVTIETEKANNAVGKLDFSVFDPARLPLGAMGMTLDEFRRGGVEATNFKNALIETNEIVREMRSESESKASNTYTQTFSSAEEAAKALGLSVEEVKNQIQETYESVSGMANTVTVYSSIEEAAKAMGISIEEAKQKTQEAYNIMYGQDADKPTAVSAAADMAAHQAQRIESVREAFGNASDAAKKYVAELLGMDVSELFNKTEVAVIKTDEAVKSLAARFSELLFGAEGLNGSFKRMFPTISGLLNRFKQLVKYRMLRAVIKQISDGFKEGYENYYHYSEAIGSGFAPAMDSATSSLLQMKNSIGAAVAPLLQALVPVLQTVVNWFIEAVNYANQFIALLRGQTTWSRATTQSAKAFDDTKKAAKGAAAAIKDLLADWDELNIIQSDSSGSGSGVGADAMTDYLEMFEEVAEFDNDIKLLVEGIKEQFGSILNLAAEIGLALLGWKFASTFTGLLGTLGGLVAAGAIIDLEFKVSEIFNGNYLKTGEVGWLVKDALTTLLGGFLMKKVLDKVISTGAGKAAIPLILAVTALAGIKTLLGNNDVTALSKEALIDSAYNALKIGGVGAFLLKDVAGYSLGTSIAGGVGLAVTTMGIIIGLKAIADTVNTSEITQETVKANFLSAGLVGTGLMIGEAVLGGTVGTIMTVGGIGAVATLGALFAVEALLTLNKGEGIVPIQWGDYEATEEEIKAFIDSEVFSGAPSVEIDLANATFKELGDKKTELQANASKMLGTLRSVKLGLTSSANADLRKEVKTFTETFNSTSEAYQDALKISVSLVPVNGSETESESIVNNSESRWSELNGIMKNLADDLTAQFDIAYNDKLDDVTRKNAEESIRKISDMMSRIAEAVSSGQVQAKVAHNLNTQIGNLTQESMDDMLKYYEEQRDQLIQELIASGNEGAEGLLAQQYAYERLAEYALKDAGYNTEDETYKHYIAQAEAAKADYENRLKTLQSDAERIADQTLSSTEGVKKMRNALLNPFAEKVSLSADELFARAGVGDLDLFKEYIQKKLDSVSSGDLDINDSNLREELANVLYQILYDVVGKDNIGEYEQAIKNGIIGYGDIFSETFVRNLMEGFGTGKTEEGKQIIRELLAELFPAYSSNVSEATKETAEQVKDEINEELADTVSEVTVNPKDILSVNADGKELQKTIIEPIEAVTEAVNDYVEAVEKVNKLMIGRHGRELVQDMLQFMADPSTTARNINDRLSEARLKNSVSGGGWNDYLEVRDIIQSMIDRYKEMYEAGNVDIFELLDEFGDFGTGEGISIPVTLIPEIDWSKIETEKELEFRDVDPADFSGRMHNFNPNNISASGGMSDMWASGWHGNGGGAQPVIVQNDAEQQNNTAAGVQKGTVELESMLSQILTFVRRIEGKEFTAKVVPSSGIGRSNAMSADLFNRVTGQNA